MAKTRGFWVELEKFGSALHLSVFFCPYDCTYRCSDVNEYMHRSPHSKPYRLILNYLLELACLCLEAITQRHICCLTLLWGSCICCKRRQTGQLLSMKSDNTVKTPGVKEWIHSYKLPVTPDCSQTVSIRHLRASSGCTFHFSSTPFGVSITFLSSITQTYVTTVNVYRLRKWRLPK